MSPLLAQVLASGSSFALGIRLAPRQAREAMAALYLFCRAVDDIADAPGTDPAAALAALEGWRRAARAGFAPAAAHGEEGPAAGPPPVLRAALAAAVARHALPLAPFAAIVDGVAMDLQPGLLLAPDEATFTLYCRRVAGAVGEVLVAILGCPGPAPAAYALAQGEALQITNILRDLDEDAALGRLYLPAPLLAAAGIAPPWRPAEVLAHPGLAEACTRMAARAVAGQAAAGVLFAALPPADRRRLRPAWLMAAGYDALRRRLERRGWTRRTHTPRLGPLALAGLVARSRLPAAFLRLP